MPKAKPQQPPSSTERRVSIVWTKGLSEEKKESFLQALRHDTIVLGRLKEILLERVRDQQQAEQADDAYDSPAWGYKQAHMNGRRQELKDILSLLAFL